MARVQGCGKSAPATLRSVGYVNPGWEQGLVDLWPLKNLLISAARDCEVIPVLDRWLPILIGWTEPGLWPAFYLI